MTKVLNLDELETSVEKTIVIKGKSHAMKPFSVEEFINQMKEIETLGDAPTSGIEMYEMSLRMIQRAFPTLTERELRKLNTFQIDAIYDFLKAKAGEEVERGASEGN